VSCLAGCLAARLVKLSSKRFSNATDGASSAAGLIGSTPVFAALDSGKSLWDSCNDPNDTSKQSYCLGYVAGVSDVLAGMHIICIGQHVSVLQIVDVVVQYLRQHPGPRDMDADDLTATALALAFPCK
jgi:hypothetical protein